MSTQPQFTPLYHEAAWAGFMHEIHSPLGVSVYIAGDEAAVRTACGDYVDKFSDSHIETRVPLTLLDTYASILLYRRL